MKLANLFLITALVGVVAAVGCADNPPPPNGTGGSGGSAGSGGSGGAGTDACVGPLCDASERKAACNAMIDECNETVEVDLTPEQCNEVGNEIFCNEGAGGSGGAGGGGGTGGAGGGAGDLGCNVLACAEDDTLKQKCEDAVEWCFAYCATEECAEDECLGLGLLICNVAE